MFGSPFKILMLISLAVSISACSMKKKEAGSGEPLRVQVPFVINGEYGLHILDLLTIQDFPHLSGSAAEFLLDPDAANGVLHGRAPEIHYIRNSEGVLVPSDALSLQLVTVYVHYEKLKELDVKVGAKDVLTYPRVVAVNTLAVNSGEMQTNNALYSGVLDALLFVPYTMENLPIMANGGVIGHEHFHSFFQKLVTGALGDKYPKGEDAHSVYHEVLLRGVNEGLADVWGWVYTGDSGFVGRSLQSEKLSRSLDEPLLRIMSRADLRGRIFPGAEAKDLLGSSYQLGNQIARGIRSFATLYAKRASISLPEARLEIGRAVIKALPLLKEKIANLKEDEYLTPMVAFDVFSLQIPGLSAQECVHFAKLAKESDRTPERAASCQRP